MRNNRGAARGDPVCYVARLWTNNNTTLTAPRPECTAKQDLMRRARMSGGQDPSQQHRAGSSRQRAALTHQSDTYGARAVKITAEKIAPKAPPASPRLAGVINNDRMYA